MTTSTTHTHPHSHGSTQPLSVDIWLDVACPWCALGERRFDNALESLPFADDVEVRFHSFQLDPGAPERSHQTHNSYLLERGVPAERLAQSQRTLTESGKPLGFHFDIDHTIPSNTRTAHRLIQAAGTVGRQREVVAAIYSAYFEHGSDIGDHAALKAVVVGAGLPEDLAERVLSDANAFLPEFEEDVQRAADLGIRGVPFYVIDGRYGISGAQPEETLRGALTDVYAELNPAPQLTMTPGLASTDGEVCGPTGCEI